jgi:sugar/nucleoside kinase (ribokinase family)
VRRKISVVSVGDVMLDVLCAELPAAGERVHADVLVRPGGSAVNAAIAAAGASATVVGRVGNDATGDLIAAALAGRGVDARLARDPELPTGVAVALGGDAVVAQRGANARLAPEDVPPELTADALFVSGFALLQEGSRAAARAALERFRGRWAGIDLASPGLAARATAEVTAGANVVFATADEARALTRAGPEEAARTLAERFEVVCVKLGPDGALAASDGAVERCAVEPVERRSPFGAGDAFAGAFLTALGGGASVGAALELACAAGARAASA